MIESAIVSVNGKVMGDLDDLVKQPTEEFKEAMRGLVERAMPASQPVGHELASKSGFDYRRIEEQYRDEVRAAAQSIHLHGRSIVSEIVTIGKRLIEVKDMIPHGEFADWIAGEFQMDERTAQRMMNVWRQYGDIQNRQTLSVFSPSVLYLLAAPSTPEEARAEVEQAAAQGKKITVEFAKETIQKRKPALEQVAYTSAIVLENMVWEWVGKHARETTHTPLAVLEFLDEGKTTRADKERRQLGAWLRERGVDWRADDDLSQAIKHAHTRQQQAANQASAKVTYLGVEVEQPVMRLLTLDMRSDAFNALLLTASLEQLHEALKRVPPNSEKERFLKIGNRRELLMLAQDAAQVDALIQAAMPMEQIEQATQIAPDQITPLDLQLAGFEIVRQDEYWRWKKDGVFGGVMGNDGYLFSDSQKAIAEARRAASKGYKYLAHEEYYPVKHGLGVMPDDLLAAGYSLENGDGSKEEEVGKHGYRWRIGDEVGPDVAYGGCAIEGARAHYEAYKPAPEITQLTPLEPVAPDKYNDGNINSAWVVYVLANYQPTNIDFDPALLMATSADLDEATRVMRLDMFVQDRIREIASRKRHLKSESAADAPQPTPLEQAIAEATPAVEPLSKPLHVESNRLQIAGFKMEQVDDQFRYVWHRQDKEGVVEYSETFPYQADAYDAAFARLRECGLDDRFPVTAAEPKLSKVDIINRDLDAYEAEAKREVAEMFAESGEPLMPPDLVAAGYTLIDTKPGPGWRWELRTGKATIKGPSIEHNKGIAISPEAAIADARRHWERRGGTLPKPSAISIKQQMSGLEESDWRQIIKDVRVLLNYTERGFGHKPDAIEAMTRTREWVDTVTETAG